jgi:hypothetical protein
MELRAFLGDLVIKVVESSGQTPFLDILIEPGGNRPHASFYCQAMLYQVLVF